MKKVKRKQIDFGGTEEQVVRGDGSLGNYDKKVVVNLTTDKTDISEIEDEALECDKTAKELINIFKSESPIEWRLIIKGDKPITYILEQGKVTISNIEGAVSTLQYTVHLDVIDITSNIHLHVSVIVRYRSRTSGTTIISEQYTLTIRADYYPTVLRTMNDEVLLPHTYGNANLHDGFYFPNAMQDVDGNWYGAIVVGDYVIIDKNLRTEHYNDGTEIPLTPDSNANGARYYPHRDESLFELEGYQYSYTAVVNSRGIAPEHWHVPTREECENLWSYLTKQSRYNRSGVKALAVNRYWNNTSAENILGTTITPLGLQYDNENYGFGRTIHIATSTSYGNTKYYTFTLGTMTTGVATDSQALRQMKSSVRLISDYSPQQFRNWYVRTYGSMQHILNDDFPDNKLEVVKITKTTDNNVDSYSIDKTPEDFYNMKQKGINPIFYITDPTGENVGSCLIGSNSSYISVWTEEDDTKHIAISLILYDPPQTVNYNSWYSLEYEGEVTSEDVITITKGGSSTVINEVVVCSYGSSYSAVDKTPEEIYTAYTNNKVVICKLGNIPYYLSLAYFYNDSYVIIFSAILNPNGIPEIGYIMYRNDVWSYNSVVLQKQLIASGANQNIKTVNNQSLLGSGNINFDASDIHALPDTTKYGASLNLTFDDRYVAIDDPTGSNPAQEGWFERSGTDPNYVYTLTEDTTPVQDKTYYRGASYIISATLRDQDGNVLGSSQSIDLPLESVVVDGTYNNNTKNVELVLKNGHKIVFSVADLVRGLQTEITLQNPLSADLLVDGTNNKVFSAADKTKLDNIESGAQVNVKSDWNQTNSSSDDYIKNKPTALSSFTNDVGYLTAADISASIVWCNYTETDSTNHTGTMSMTISEMQTAIASGYIVCLRLGDLVYTLNSKATLAAKFCCVQGVTIHSLTYYDSDSLWHYSSNTLQVNLISGTNIKTINNNSILGSGNLNIREIPAANESNNGKMLKIVNGEWAIVPIAPAYHHAGTKTVAQLIPDLLIAANEGNVYNITDTGTTTDYFIEGSGFPIKAGDNVGIAKVEGSYKFDLLSGFVDTSGFALKSEMSITDGTGANADKTTIQLKSGLTKQVLTQHQDISGKADKSEMVITPGTGDNADKVNIQLKSGTTATVLTTHQDISGKADVNGNYPNITVGLAQNLDDKVTVEEPFLLRPSPNFKGALGKSVRINEIKGRSSKWNQTGNCGNNNTWFTGSNTGSSVTTSGVIANFDAAEATKELSIHNQFPDVHIYYVTFDYITNKSCTLNVMDISRTVEATTSYVRYEKYGVRPEQPDNNIDFTISYDTEDVWTVEIKNLNVIDVTVIFGAGNEPATKADFQLWLATNVGFKSFYPYDAGSLLSVKLKEFESIGFNQWDEEWELGSIDENGAFVNSSIAIRTKNYYQVIGGETYYFTGGNAVIYIYDANKTFIPYTGQTGNRVWRNGIDVTNNTFILPLNVAYIRFTLSNNYGATYNHNICINLSHDGSRNGEYEPYWKRTIPFDVTKITGINPNTNVRELVFPNGMRSAGSAYDRIYSDGKVAKAVVNVGSTKISSLYWEGTTTTTSGVYRFKTNSLSSTTAEASISIRGASMSSIGNIICPKYLTVSDNGTRACNVGIAVDPYGVVTVHDPNYGSSYTTWKTAMADIPIFYQLANPITYTDLQDENGEPIELPLITKASNGGTERLLPQNESSMEVITPILNIEYQVDVEDRIDIVEKTITNKLLPTVTAADNGKILMVNNGAWSVESVPVSDSVLH